MTRSHDRNKAARRKRGEPYRGRQAIGPHPWRARLRAALNGSPETKTSKANQKENDQ